jgi:hypothetical protein
MMRMRSGSGGKTAPWREDVIKKVKNGYQALSSTGRNLGGPYGTFEEAKKRRSVFARSSFSNVAM